MQIRVEDEFTSIQIEDDRGRKSFPENVQLALAGGPVGYSERIDSMTAGMKEASYDRVVWTDDDFHHPPGWLDRLHNDDTEYDPMAELPAFVGQDLAVLLEPTYYVPRANLTSSPA